MTDQNDNATYIVWDRETNRITAVDLTLTQAVNLRDALTTVGNPSVAPQLAGDREGGLAS